jgi:hypothetical protein
MLTDPLAITYNAVAKSLPRASRVRPGMRKVLQSTTYGTNDGEFSLFNEFSVLGNVNGFNMRQAFIGLSRSAPDTDSDPFNSKAAPPNLFGLLYQFPEMEINTSVDIPRLRTALLALVDSTLEGRLINGET